MPKSKSLLDVQTQILKELTSPASFQWNVRESYAKIAKKLGIDEETVRLAVKRAKESGFVANWRMILNPNLLGEISGSFQLEVDDLAEKSRILSQLKLLDDVMLMFDFHDRWLRIIFNFNSEKNLQRKLELFRLICQPKNKGDHKKETYFWKTTSPPCDLKLSRLDWQILKAMSKDPRRNIQEIASEVQASTRTINRRLRAMMEGRTFYLIPVRNVQKSSGLLCNFLVLHKQTEQSKLDELLDSVRERIDFVYREKGLLNFSVMLDNIAEADALAESLKRLSGVTDLKMNIIKDFIYVDHWLDDIIERKLLERI